MKASLTRFWLERTPRERAIMGIGGALLVLALAYAYAWMPISASRQRMMGELPRLRAQAHQMRIDAQSIERLRDSKTAAAVAPRDLRAALTAASARLVRSGAPQVSAESDGRLRVAFASVRADEWILWVSTMALELGIRVDDVRADTLETAGTIKVTSTFSTGHPP